MVLVILIQFHKVAAPSPDAHDQVPVFLRMLLRVKHGIPVDGIELKLMAAQIYKGFDQCGDLGDAFLIAEQGIMQLQRQGSSVYDFVQFRLCEGFYNGNGSLVSCEQAGRIVAGKAFAGPAAVRGGSQIAGKPQILHGGTGSCPEAAASFIPASLQGFRKSMQKV